MTRPSRLAIVAIAFAVACGSAQAEHNLLGVWKGKIILHIPTVPKNATAADKAEFAKRLPQVRAELTKKQAEISKGIVTLTLSANHKFVMKVTGATVPDENRTRSGNWTLKGNQLALLDSVSAIRQNPFTVAKDGKSFMLTLPNGIASLRFSR